MSTHDCITMRGCQTRINRVLESYVRAQRKSGYHVWVPDSFSERVTNRGRVALQSACRGEIKFGNGLHPYAVPMLTSLVKKASLLRILENPFVELRSKATSALPHGAS